MHKKRQSRRFLGRLLGQLIKTGLPLIGNVLKTPSVLILLGLTAAAPATDAVIYKKMFGFDRLTLDLASRVTTLIISNEKMIDIMKIVKSYEESGLLIKDFSETINNEEKKQKRGFLGILLGFLDTSLLGNILTSKGRTRSAQDF